jgi:hypothetical protein
MQVSNVDMVIVGSTTYMKAGGQWMKMTMPDATATLAKLRRPGAMGGYLDRSKVTDLGLTTLGGRPMHRYRIQTQEDGTAVDSTLWVGTDELPYRDDVATKSGTVTVLYSGYNAPIKISPPI